MRRLNKQRWLLCVLVLVLAGVGGLVLARSLQHPTNPASLPLGNPQPQIPIVQPFGTPTSLAIPKLHINAPIESVGLDNKNAMDVPKDPTHVAWYQLGYKPGQQGSAVIAGHLDSATIGKAIFWNLHELAPGDMVTVIDDAQHKLDFQVRSQTSYPTDQFPLQAVFGTAGEATLNLITCTGTFTGSAGYDQRLVVSTILANPNQ